MRRLLLLAIAVILAGCASVHPLDVACISCGLLVTSGACEKEAACPVGQVKMVVNYERWAKGLEPPRVE